MKKIKRVRFAPQSPKRIDSGKSPQIYPKKQSTEKHPLIKIYYLYILPLKCTLIDRPKRFGPHIKTSGGKTQWQSICL